MASEYELEAQAELDNRARQEKIDQFLRGGSSALLIAEAAVCAWVDAMNAEGTAECLLTDIVIAEGRKRYGSSHENIRYLRNQRDFQLSLSARHREKAAELGAIAGAAHIVEQAHQVQPQIAD